MNTNKKIAYIYGGQGAQHIHMADELMEIPNIKVFFHAIEKVLNLTVSTWFESEEKMQSTEAVQLLLFLVQEAWTHMLLLDGITPDAVAGQSLGEYNAMLTAKTLDAHTLAQMVKARGAAMAQCVTPKTIMKAVVGNLENLDQLLNHPGLYLANENGPKQVVIGGEPQAFDAVKELPEGIKRLIPLNTQAAFHTPYMAPARIKLSPLFSNTVYDPPIIDLYQNISGEKAATVTAQDLLDHLIFPVRFGAMIHNMVNDGITDFIEISPRPHLHKLIQQNAPHQNVYSVHSIATLDAVIETLKGESHA